MNDTPDTSNVLEQVQQSQQNEYFSEPPYLETRIEDTNIVNRIFQSGMQLIEQRPTEFELLATKLRDSLEEYEKLKAETDQKWGLNTTEKDNNRDQAAKDVKANSEISSENIDTDSREGRQIRARNHFEFEQSELPQTFGLSFRDRFLLIQRALFKGTDKNLNKNEILSDTRTQIQDEFMPSNETAQLALEQYAPLIDSWYNTIQKLPQAVKQEATFRMLSTLFVSGILIHPAEDGNGQISKTLVLSYMHDLLPEFRDKFIPIKYSSTNHDKKHEMSIPFMGGGAWLSPSEDLTAGAVLKITPHNEIDAKLVKYLQEMQALDIPYINYEQYTRQKEEAQAEIAKQAAQELNMPELLTPQVIGYTEKKNIFNHIKRTPREGISLNSFQTACFNYLSTQNYPSEQVKATAHSTMGQKIDRASNAVRQLLTTQEGLAVLNDYVLTGNVHINSENKLQSELFHKAVSIFDRQKANINATLETRDEHLSRHQEMMTLLI